MYYLLFLITLYGAIKEAVTHKRNKALFNFTYICMFLMAIFRYGQGQDYFNYEGVYHQVTVFTEQSILGIFLINDIGYAFINYIALSLNIPYEIFMAIFTAIIMGMFYSFLKRSCNYSMVSLFVFYSVIYMIYVLSIVRQGFNIAFFLCFMLPLIEQHKYTKFYFLTLLISTIHASALLFFLFPLINSCKWTYKTLIFLFLISIVILFFSMNLMSYIPVPFIQDRMRTYLDEASGNLILAKIVRLLLVFPLLLLPTSLFKTTRDNRIFFFWGFLIYALISFSELASSRIWGYFLGFECIILANLAMSKIRSKSKVLIVLFYILLSSVLWIKDIYGAMQQGEYRNCTILTYPYISIFEGDQTINYYRTEKGATFVETN